MSPCVHQPVPVGAGFTHPPTSQPTEVESPLAFTLKSSAFIVILAYVHGPAAGNVGHLFALIAVSSPPVHTAVPPCGVLSAPPVPKPVMEPPSSRHSVKTVTVVRKLACTVAILAFCLAFPKLANTMEERSPMMEITTKSSMRVNPEEALSE